VQVSALDCRGDGADHLRAALLVSPAPDLRGMTYRELQIPGMVVADWADEHIATALDMTAGDVAECIQRSMYLLAVPSRTGLSIRALREGLPSRSGCPDARSEFMPARTAPPERGRGLRWTLTRVFFSGRPATAARARVEAAEHGSADDLAAGTEASLRYHRCSTGELPCCGTRPPPWS
jgi:hypothetical protein